MNFSIYNIIHVLLIFLEVLLIIVLILRGRKSISNKFLALFFLAQFLFSLNEFYIKNLNFDYKDYPFFGYVSLPFYLLWGPSIYLYVKSQIEIKYKFKWKDILHFLPFVLLTLYFTLEFHTQGLDIKKQLLNSREMFSSSNKQFYSMFIFVQILVYNILSVLLIENYAKEQVLKSEKIISRIKWNRLIVYGYFFIFFFNNIAILVFKHSKFRNIPVYLHTSALLFFMFFSVVLGYALFSSPLGKSIKLDTQKSLSKDEFFELKEVLSGFMEKEKPFLEFGLTLSKLALLLNTNDRLLSRFINVNYKLNFQDFINLYRVEEAKKLIEKSVNSKKTILEIVYESGFNSKSAFNYAFKKHCKKTPTQYKKSLM